MNQSPEDEANQWAIACAVVDERIETTGKLHRMKKHPDFDRTDFTFYCLNDDTWYAAFLLEAKARWKKYDPFKVSKAKLDAGFKIAQIEELPLVLGVWFSEENFVRVMRLPRLNFIVSEIGHGKRGEENIEPAYEIPLQRFLAHVPITEKMLRSPNSER